MENLMGGEAPFEPDVDRGARAASSFGRLPPQ